MKAKIKNELLDNFIVALELLCSPELVIKVCTAQPCHYFKTEPFAFSQDYFDNDLKPIMESSVVKRDKRKVNQIWQDIHRQLTEWKEGSSASSLYGEQTPSVEIGVLQKNFAKVRMRQLQFTLQGPVDLCDLFSGQHE